MEALVRRVLHVQRGGRYNLQASSALRVGIENQRDDVRRGAHIGASLHRHVVRRVGKAPPEADTGFGGRLSGRLRNRRLRLQPAEHLPRGAIAERRILPDLQRLGDTHFDTVRTDFLQRKTESAAGNRHCRRSGGAYARVGDLSLIHISEPTRP